MIVMLGTTTPKQRQLGLLGIGPVNLGIVIVSDR